MPDICYFASRAAFLFLLVFSLSFHSARPHAEGALALGLPNDVAKEGMSYGYTVKSETSDAAKASALKACQTDKNGSKAGQKLCRVVETFKGKCVAIALDPKAGTPGVGWSVAGDRETAEAQAMSHCKATAGADRESFCKLDNSVCDM